MFLVYVVRLFQIQIIDGEYYATMADKVNEVEIVTEAARGEIYDTNMRPLSINTVSFTVVFDYAYFPSKSQMTQRNQTIDKLTKLLKKHDVEWVDTLPISKKQPFKFLKDREKSESLLKEYLSLANYATAQQCMDKLIERYDLEKYKPEQQRILAAVQYEIDQRNFSYNEPFKFATGISDTLRNIILENSLDYPGVTVETSYVREYVNGDIASHLLGTVGPIFAEEYPELKKQGYRMNERVGKSGLEKAMESNLRGTAGKTVIHEKVSGSVVNSEEILAPIAGDSIVLTLDSNLQKKAQDELDSAITALRRGGKGSDVVSGSIVMTDMKGGVIVSATWPNYDLSNFNKDYADLVNHKDQPLYNRALNGVYPCGSVIKPAIALGGISGKVISPTERFISCNRVYNKFKGITLRCTGYHGSLGARGAVQKSCNIYFYELGRKMGLEMQAKYNEVFGLGQSTGIELNESIGTLAAPGTTPGYATDSVQAAIGQSTHQFTPLQLAVYAQTLANDGTRYQAHLVKGVRAYDGTEIPFEPKVMASIDLDPNGIVEVREGMKLVAKPGGTAGRPFSGFKHNVAGKTGTAQTGHVNRSDHTLFIGYAPADKPEICISVILEHGRGPDPAYGPVLARRMLDHYFDSRPEDVKPIEENMLIA